MSMLRHARAWRHILRVPTARKMSGYFHETMRYYTLKALEKEGLFEYLKEPKTFGEILSHFNYIDSDYTRLMFDILSTDPHPTIIKDGEHYRTNPAEKIPVLEDILARTDERFRGIINLAVDMSQNISPRLHGKPTEFTQAFAAPGREMMQSFDDALGLKMYTVVRDAAFAFLPRKDREWLHGKRMLELGCGSGRETAELWVHMKGQTHITATDPAEPLVKLAEANFERYVNELDPQHVPITDQNRPTFQVLHAAGLPYDDDSYDAIYYQMMLHYVGDPPRTIREFARVLKPEGLIFGAQITRPRSYSPYSQLIITSNEASHGFFWDAEHQHWYQENGFAYETSTPMGVFRAKGSPERKQARSKVAAPSQGSGAG
jgi:ubiquinone/menaquinone biosynthesis C-methylase UbiE